MFSKRVFFTGRVQGVGFRFSTKRIAGGYEVIGWVKNLADGRVEMLAMSWEEGEIDAFLAGIGESELAGFIKEVDVTDCEPEEGITTFGIR